MMTVSRSAAALVLCSLVLGIACGGGSPSPGTPSSPAPPTTTLAPAPAPTPIPGTTCHLGYGVANENCSRDTASFLPDVEAAIDKLVAEEPDIFDLNADKGGGAYRVLSQGRYLLGMVRNMEAKGYCAEWNGEEFLVKNSQAYDDAYDILTGDSYVRRGANSYRGSCYPASFPIDTGPLPPTPDCPAGPSKAVACSRDRSTYLDVMETAIDRLARERPNVFDVTRTAPGTGNWYKVVDVAGYLQGMKDVLKAMGYCSFYDGEEMQMKKDNTFSENYDILTGNEFARRGEGSYRGSCYPAGF
jgi:hypothetical protein